MTLPYVVAILKMLAVIFGGIFFLFVVMIILGSMLLPNVPYERSENPIKQQTENSSNILGINCEFLGYQVDTHKDMLELYAMIGDADGIREYVKLQKKYKENCT